MSVSEDDNLVTVTPRADGVFVIEGDLSQLNAVAFESLVGALAVEVEGEVALDLVGLDLTDGISIATAINAVRELLSRTRRVKLIAAPQILCHNLYRVGLLGTDERIVLIAMREDEPYG